MTYTHKVIVEVLGYRSAIQTFPGHIVTKITQGQSVVSPRRDPVHQRGYPGNLGDDVGDTRDLRMGTRRKIGGEGLHDAIIDYTVEVVGISVAQELESTSESIRAR